MKSSFQEVVVSTVLSPSEVEQALQDLAGWTQRDATIERTLQFPDFITAMKFVNEIAVVAESANHHPDITINYNKVTLSLTSHDSGGITQRDIRMAGKISEVAGR
jgi:4a-hydroxytetrahydrobiopterin dehydratase